MHTLHAGHHSGEAVRSCSAGATIPDHADAICSLFNLVDSGFVASDRRAIIKCGKGLRGSLVLWQIRTVVPLEPVFLIVLSIKLLHRSQVIDFDAIGNEVT